MSAIEQNFDQRFPKPSSRGRRPVPIRVLFALELLKHALGASDDAICHRLRTDFAVMYACGLRKYQVNPVQAYFVLPETLCEFRSRLDEPLMDALIAIQAAAAMEAGLVSPAYLVIDTFPCEPGSPRVTDATTLYKAQKNAGTHRRHHADVQPPRHHPHAASPGAPAEADQSHAGFWPPMPWTGPSLCETGAPHGTATPPPWRAHCCFRAASSATPGAGQDAERCPAPAPHRGGHRGAEQSCADAQQSTQLTHGQKLRHCKLVHAYDRTIAPIIKGKSNCPAQFGRKPGIASAPATGFVFANRVPAGNPSDPSSVAPLVDKVQTAIARVTGPGKLVIQSVASDVGANDPTVRQTLHARGMLTVGMPQTIEPLKAQPTPEEIRALLNGAGLHRIRTPHQVQLACAAGYSRPVVESHIASVLARGAGQVRYKGLEGAVRHQGMIVLAHNGAVMVRIRRQQVSKRAQKVRRLLGLKSPKIKEINAPKNW